MDNQPLFLQVGGNMDQVDNLPRQILNESHSCAKLCVSLAGFTEPLGKSWMVSAVLCFSVLLK